MLGDFFTKPLQGGQFYILRDDIMNVDPWSKYHSAHRSVLSHESHDDEPGTRGCDDDVTSTEVATNGDVYERSYLEVLMQWASVLTLWVLLVKLVILTSIYLLFPACLHWTAVDSTSSSWLACPLGCFTIYFTVIFLLLVCVSILY
jgi:hypothetical protein